MSGDIEHIQLTPQTDLLRLIELVYDDQMPRLIEREGRPLAVLSPVRDPATPRQVDQRALVKQILRNRTHRVITPRTTLELMEAVRKEGEESYGEPR